MLPADFFKLVEDNDKERLALLMRKANDYAENTDVLANFKRISLMAKILGVDITTPNGYAIFMVLMKLDRICNLIFKDKQAANESIHDSIQDLIGYANLLAALISEEN